MKQIRIFGCGGAGINLAAHFIGKGREDGCAELLPALVDTSESNLRGRKLNDAALYLVQGLDGSGKIRAENHAEIARNVKQILMQIEPLDLNVVIFSASGGSGSVIGPLLLKELNDRGAPALALVVGSDESVIAAENTLKTLQSLEKISAGTGVPVVMSFHQNRITGKRSDVDRDVFSVLGCLAVLASGENREMDSKDIEHWLNYPKVSGVKAQLSSLHICTSNDTFGNVSQPLSVASLYGHPDNQHVTTSADYHAVGYTDLSALDVNELHFAISAEDLGEIGAEIKATVDKLLQGRNARVGQNILLKDVQGQETDDMLVL